MKRVFFIGILFAVIGFSSLADAATSTWIDQSNDYSIGDIVGGWQVLEYKDAYYGTPPWTVQGQKATGGGVRNFGPTALYFYKSNSYAVTTFSIKSTAIAFMLESDSNDSKVDFSVDGVPVFNTMYDMKTLPGYREIPGEQWRVGTLVVSGLSDDYHTVRIANGIAPFVTGDRYYDFHLYGAAAVAPVPVPAGLLLFAPGLAGLALLRRRFKK